MNGYRLLMSPLVTSRPPGILHAELKGPRGPLVYPPSWGGGGGLIEAQRGEAPAKITPGAVTIPGVEPCFLLPGGVFFLALGWVCAWGPN